MTERSLDRYESVFGARWRDEFLKAATNRGANGWDIPYHVFISLLRKHQPAGQHEPTAIDLASRATFAAWRAVKAAALGERVFVSEDILEHRRLTCNACEMYDAEARFGLGKCKHPQCGCTKFKQWLATERCPLGKWQA